MKLCPYCIEAIQSRGEKLKLLLDLTEEEGICEWCEEESEELTEAELV